MRRSMTRAKKPRAKARVFAHIGETDAASLTERQSVRACQRRAVGQERDLGMDAQKFVLLAVPPAQPAAVARSDHAAGVPGARVDADLDLDLTGRAFDDA